MSKSATKAPNANMPAKGNRTIPRVLQTKRGMPRPFVTDLDISAPLASVSARSALPKGYSTILGAYWRTVNCTAHAPAVVEFTHVLAGSTRGSWSGGGRAVVEPILTQPQPRAPSRTYFVIEDCDVLPMAGGGPQ